VTEKMHLETWAEISLLIFGGIFSLVTVGLLGVIAFAASKLVALLDKVTNKIDPVIVKATDAIETVQRVTNNVGARADQILIKGEALTDDVSGRVEKTAGVVQNAVIGPLINLSSIINGVSKGFQVYTHPEAHHSENHKGAKQYKDQE
jgi:uncharacterized protein YoxC